MNLLKTFSCQREKVTIINKTYYTIHIVLSEKTNDVVMIRKDDTWTSSNIWGFQKNKILQKLPIGSCGSSMFSTSSDVFVTVAIKEEDRVTEKDEDDFSQQSCDEEEYKDYKILMEGFKIKKGGKLIVTGDHINDASTIRKSSQFI